MNGTRPRILIDPGHGGVDPGAERDSVDVLGKSYVAQEKKLNLLVADTLADILSEKMDFDVFMTRTFDVTLSLQDRVGIERVLAPLCFVSIHHNASPSPDPKGLEIWTSPGRTKADDLADCIFDRLLIEQPSVPVRYGGTGDAERDKEGRFYVLVNTCCPAVLIEVGFISNDKDVFRTLSYLPRYNLCLAIANGIKDWAGGGKKS